MRESARIPAMWAMAEPANSYEVEREPLQRTPRPGFFKNSRR